jgi:DNA-binding CsgD family transcriptional regulator
VQTDHGITEQEKRVLRLMARGKTTDEIADTLGVSPNTIKSHRDHIHMKLGAHTADQAVAKARKASII